MPFFLNLNKFLPASKAWKVFTNKVQTRFHKFNRSKAIKKPNNRFRKPPKRFSWPNLCVHGKPFKPRKKLPKTLVYHTHHHFQRKPSAVYVDQLFIEPVTIVQEHAQLPVNAVAVGNEEMLSSSRGKDEEVGDHDDQHEIQITEGTGEEDSADDMWESLVLASHHMNGIDERAEEFIARFHADMRLQERLAHRM